MPLNDLQKAVFEFTKKHNLLAREVSDELIDKIGIKTNPDKVLGIISNTFAKAGYKKEVVEELFGSIVQAVSLGAGVSIRGKAKVNSFKAWYTEYAYKPWGDAAKKQKWSARINDLNRIDEITKDIRASIKAGQSMQQAAQFLHDKGIQKADVAKDIQRIIDKARTVYGISNDSEGYIAFKKEVAKVQKRINTLTRQDTSKLRRAYQDILDITNKSSAAQVERAIKYTAYFKDRYNAERIARTEMGRSYGDASFSDAIYNSDVIGIKFMLSSGHDIFDICCHPDTKILGETVKKISEIKIGDMVLTHTGELKPVEKVYISKKDDLILISFCSILSGEPYLVKLTHNHPVLTDKGFVPVSDLKKGCLCIFQNELSDEPPRQRVYGDNRIEKLSSNRNDTIQKVEKTFSLLYGVLKDFLFYYTSRIFYFLFHPKHSKAEKIDLNLNHSFDNALPSNSDYSRLFSFLKVLIDVLPAFSTFQRDASHNLDYSLRSLERIFENNKNDFHSNNFFHRICIFLVSLRGIFCSNQYYKKFFQYLCLSLISNVFFCKSGKAFQILKLLSPFKPPVCSDMIKSYIKYTLIASKCQVSFINSVTRIKNETGFVYNLSVKDNNTYFANGLLVHNCDLHTGADLFGMGEGVYPKEYAPEFPFHPNCLCSIVKVFEGEADHATKEDYNPNGGKAYLNKLSAKEQQQILGVSGREAFKANPKSWEKIIEKKGYRGLEVKEATIPREVLYGGK